MNCPRCGRYQSACACEYFTDVFIADYAARKKHGGTVQNFRQAFKRRMKGHPCERQGCRHGITGVIVCEHIVPVSRNRDISCDIRNVRLTCGCVNLDLYKSNTKRLEMIRMFFPDALKYAKEHMREKPSIPNGLGRKLASWDSSDNVERVVPFYEPQPGMDKSRTKAMRLA